MKKILIFTAILMLAATSSFAATDVTSTDAGVMSLAASTGLELHGDATSATKDTALIGKCSTGVGVAWATNVNGYALVTQHKSGTKAYASSYDSTALYQSITDATPGAEVLANPTNTDTTDFSGTNWKKM